MNSPSLFVSALAHCRQVTLEEIAQAIDNGRPNTWGDRDWTVGIKSSVAKLGRAAGWNICTSSVAGIERECEWLFDQTWYRNENGMLRELGLVLESEWGDFPSVRYDFEKLLVARAPLKVMIYCDEALECENSFAQLARGIFHYKHRDADDRFLLACWRGAKMQFEFRRLAGDGTLLT